MGEKVREKKSLEKSPRKKSHEKKRQGKKFTGKKKFRKFSSKLRQAEVCNLIHSEVMNKRKGKVRFKGMCENTLSGSKQN